MAGEAVDRFDLVLVGNVLGIKTHMTGHTHQLGVRRLQLNLAVDKQRNRSPLALRRKRFVAMACQTVIDRLRSRLK